MTSEYELPEKIKSIGATYGQASMGGDDGALIVSSNPPNHHTAIVNQRRQLTSTTTYPLPHQEMSTTEETSDYITGLVPVCCTLYPPTFTAVITFII